MGAGELSRSDWPDLLNLHELKWRVIPDSCPKASCQLKSIPCCDRVFSVDCTVDQTADQTGYMLKDDRGVREELLFVFPKVFFVARIKAAKCSLDDQ